MKKIGLLLILISYFSFSQNKQVLYGLHNTPQSLLINPGGEIENDWYFGIPFLSHIHANVGFSGVTAYDLFADNNVAFSEKITNVINRLDANDFFGANEQIEIFSGGLALQKGVEKNNYLSFGVYQESDVIAYFPKDLATLALEGNANNINRVFNFDQLKIAGESLLVFHAGLTRKASEKLNYGFRGKIYYSLFNASFINNKGGFVTTQGDSNFYDHIFDLDLELRTSGVKGFDGNTTAGEVLKEGNFGLGFDLGFTHRFTKQTTLDASLLDLGFIRHSRKTENYFIKNTYVFSGINPLFPQGNSAETAQEYWNEIEDNFEDTFEISKNEESYTTLRPVKLNLALRYAFETGLGGACNCLNTKGNYLSEIGVQFYSVTRPKNIQSALSIYYYRNLFNALKLKGTYTIDSYSFKNIGAGLSTQIGPINFYLLADNLIDFKNLAKARSASIQLGFNYVFNEK